MNKSKKCFIDDIYNELLKFNNNLFLITPKIYNDNKIGLKGIKGIYVPLISLKNKRLFKEGIAPLLSDLKCEDMIVSICEKNGRHLPYVGNKYMLNEYETEEFLYGSGSSFLETYDSLDEIPEFILNEYKQDVKFYRTVRISSLSEFPETYSIICRSIIKDKIRLEQRKDIRKIKMGDTIYLYRVLSSYCIEQLKFGKVSMVDYRKDIIELSKAIDIIYNCDINNDNFRGLWTEVLHTCSRNNMDELVNILIRHYKILEETHNPNFVLDGFKFTENDFYNVVKLKDSGLYGDRINTLYDCMYNIKNERGYFNTSDNDKNFSPKFTISNTIKYNEDESVLDYSKKCYKYKAESKAKAVKAAQEKEKKAIRLIYFTLVASLLLLFVFFR